MSKDDRLANSFGQLLALIDCSDKLRFLDSRHGLGRGIETYCNTACVTNKSDSPGKPSVVALSTSIAAHCCPSEVNRKWYCESPKFFSVKSKEKAILNTDSSKCLLLKERIHKKTYQVCTRLFPKQQDCYLVILLIIKDKKSEHRKFRVDTTSRQVI